MTVWTMAWWTQAERKTAAAAVEVALRDWAAQWGASLLEPLVGDDPKTVGETDLATWLLITGTGDRDGVWMTHPDTVAKALGGALCCGAEKEVSAAHRQGGPMSVSVGRAAARALAAVLCVHFDWTQTDGAPDKLPSCVVLGGLLVTLQVGDASLRLMFSAGVAKALAGRRQAAPSSPLVALQDVVGPRPITLNVALRPVRLEIGSLCSLAVGDVIALDHKLDEPVNVFASDASAVAQAHLARTGIQKAIRLDRAAP